MAKVLESVANEIGSASGSEPALESGFPDI
jgi:hypothetical protein